MKVSTKLLLRLARQEVIPVKWDGRILTIKISLNQNTICLMETILKSASMLTIDKENKYFDVISMKLLSTKFPK